MAEKSAEPEAGHASLDDKSRWAAPSISLPKGGGAIRGIGEKFNADSTTGAAAMEIPIYASAGRADFGPKLALTYSSGGGNGPFGLGFSIGLPTITRRTDKGLPRYADTEDSDIFLISGAEDLVPALAENRRGEWHEAPPATRLGYAIQMYRPRLEGMFARIERWTRVADGDTHWRSISRDNVLSFYGLDAGARIADPQAPNRIYSWLISLTLDEKGNAVAYDYAAEDDAEVDPEAPGEQNRERRANRFISRVRYGNRIPAGVGERPWHVDPGRLDAFGWMFSLIFDYDEGRYHEASPDDEGRVFARASVAPDRPWPARRDPFSSYRSGFEIRTHRLCARVMMFHHFPDELGVYGQLVHSTSFHYRQTPTATFLEQAVSNGHVRQPDGSYLTQSLPPVDLRYSRSPIADGRLDKLTVAQPDAASLSNLPAGVDGRGYRWLDLDGEGLPGVLTEQGGAWHYKHNLGGGHLGPMRETPVRPAGAGFSAPGRQFLDVAGDGVLELVDLNPTSPGFFERTADGGWGVFRSFDCTPNLKWSDPNLRFIDVTGDGVADVLITEDEALTWHPSLQEHGFGAGVRVRVALTERAGPRVLFGNAEQSLYVADMSGDGLADLVRIRDGEICYWPNLGYGRFGRKITMTNAPRFDELDLFDQKRVRLADTDGSGPTDILYVTQGGIDIYLNQSGTSWSTPRRISDFPAVDDLSAISVVDLLGRGGACLVWSSALPAEAGRPLRYVDLMAGGKPHLLIRIDNNMGAETTISYAASTEYYLADKAAGRPWITRLAFPVHVVARVEIFDHLSRNRFVTRFAYHHGYFDSVEREFRGFALVEQWDSERIGTFAPDSAEAAGHNGSAHSQVPPIHTRTWRHTGIYLGADHVSDFFAGFLDPAQRGEYFREPGLTDAEARDLLLPDTRLPPGLTPDEAREACRALKGAMLRQEIYADDAGPDATADQIRRARMPYTVAEQNFSVRCLQPRGRNRYGVFVTHPHETLSFHYERDPADPRVQHSLTLEVDNYGGILKAATIGYGRRSHIRVPDDHGGAHLVPNPGLQALHPADRARQTTALISFAEHRFTNPIETPDAHRAPCPCETADFELTDFVPTGRAGRFRPADFVESDPERPGRLRMKFVDEVAYEDATTGRPCRRAVDRRRSLYRRDDLRGLLPLGEVQPLALAGEAFQLAFTHGLLTRTYRRAAGDGPKQWLLPDLDAVLGGQGVDQGGFVRSSVLKSQGFFPAHDPDTDWWMGSGRNYFTANPTDDPNAERHHAERHFFLVRRYRDPFGADTVVDFDRHDLLIAGTRDPLGNHSRVEANDYNILQPRLVRDPNDNRTEVAFDALGMVVGTAVMGKPLPAPREGDSLDGFVTDLSPVRIAGFLEATNPHYLAAGLLRGATSRFIYDLHRFQRSRRENPDDPSAWQPACAASLARETHLHGAPLEGGSPQPLMIQLGFSYSDGFGREIQKKLQAEPGPLVDGGPSVNPRWVGTGWTIFNNKGKPIRHYEPFFSATHHFEFGVSIGVSAVIFYDPAERAIATMQPNGAYEKVVFDPWRQDAYDANDTCAARGRQTGDPRTDPDVAGYVAGYFRELAADPSAPPWRTWFEQRIDGQQGPQEHTVALRAAAHADTPATTHFDNLGRPFLQVTRNRVVCAGHVLDGTEARFLTRTTLDIVGNTRVVRDTVEQAGDPLGRIVMRFDYDMLRRRIRHISMDGGERWMLDDAAGKSIRAWDSRGHAFRTAYDALRRPTAQYVRGETTASDPRTRGREVLFDKTEYGEPAAGLGPEAAARALRLNLRTRIYRHFDTAGVAINARLDAAGEPVEAYDFKGNLSRSTRRFTRDHAGLPDWGGDPGLDDEAFEGGRRYDALNRTIQTIVPGSSHAHAKRSVVQFSYNEANLLDRVDAWLDLPEVPGGLLDRRDTPPSPVGISYVDYNAKGLRQRIDYRNGAYTVYGHDPLTFRLTRLRTRRAAVENATERGMAGALQDLHYTYDPVGNLTHIRDDAQQTLFFRNNRVDPSNDYTYDAVYRLIQATGREHLGQGGRGAVASGPFDKAQTRLPQPGDGAAMGAYVERYLYDAVGNVLRVQHRGSDPASPGWTRAYDYDEASLIEDGLGGAPLKTCNRLSRTVVGPAPEAAAYPYDAHGNVVSMCHLGGEPPNLHWDFKDHLRQIGLGGGGRAFYSYNASGERLRKVWEKAPGRLEERLYLDGFELFRTYHGALAHEAVSFERETLHVMDGARRIALVETRTIDRTGTDRAPERLIRYQFVNHLGSTSLELGERADIISYEEYAPFGASTYQAVQSDTEAPKRYRFTGKERDEESGFYYYSGRHYACWLARWLQCDPAEFVDGVNPYQYVGCNPIRFADPTGFGPEEQRLGASMEKASKAHQDAANAVRAKKGMAPVQVDRQKGVGGERSVIPDERKTTPGGTKQVVDTKARHVDSARNQSAAQRRADIEANLEQVKTQLSELEKAGEVGSNARATALRVVHDSDKGASSAEAVQAWRSEAKTVRQEWINAASTDAEKALRSRVFVTTTTRETYSAATRELEQAAKGVKAPHAGRAGLLVGLAIAGYILFDTGDAYAAAQAVNPAANTTDALTADHIDSFELVGGVAKDVISLTPPGAVTMLIWTVMQPRGEFYYDEGLAQRAIAQGRNPFCAQCHGEGGALDPNNAWNRRAEQKRFEGVLKSMPPMQMDNEAIRQYMQQSQ